MSNTQNINCQYPLCWTTYKLGFNASNSLSRIVVFKFLDTNNQAKPFYAYALGISGFSLNINTYVQHFEIQTKVISQSATELHVRISLIFNSPNYNEAFSVGWVKLSVLAIMDDSANSGLFWLGNMQGIENGKASPPIPVDLGTGIFSRLPFITGFNLQFPPPVSPQIQQTAISLHSSASALAQSDGSVSIQARAGMEGLNTNDSSSNTSPLSAMGIIDAGLFAFIKTKAWETQLLPFGMDGKKVSGTVNKTISFPSDIANSSVLFLLQSFEMGIDSSDQLYEYKNTNIYLDIWATIKGKSAEVSFACNFQLENQDSPPQSKTGSGSATFLAIANPSSG